MPITSVTQQPTVNKLLAAYRPVTLTVEATATGGGSTPPVVHCDIYFAGKYYKTVSKTVYATYLGASTRWSFDIQDACQEYLGKMLGPAAGTQVLNALPVMVKVFCRFRSSGLDGAGFILSEGTAPVQGTLLTQPIAGTGTTSNIFYVVNATLKHSDNQDLQSSLAYSRMGVWNAAAYPLTKRPDHFPINLDASDYFPMATAGCYKNIRLNYKLIGQNQIWQELRQVGVACDGVVINLSGFPDPGGGNITITWGSTGSVTSYEYKVDGGPAIQTTDELITLNGLSAGPHDFAIKPLCDCGSGTEVTLNFTIA